MATELTDLDLGEWSICIDPANEDCTIEIVKSKSGLGPVLKETDMSEHNEDIDNDIDEDFEQFVAEEGDDLLEEFNGLEGEEQAAALLGMAYENAIQEAAIGDAAEVIKAIRENSVSKEKYDEVVEIVKKSGALIEKMKSQGHVSDAEGGGLLDEIRKANGGVDLSPEAAARIEALEKSNNEIAKEKLITKARGFGFGKAEEVADLSMRIRKALGDKAADLYEAQIKQAGQIAKASPLFKSVGEDAGSLDANDPIAKAKVGAEQIRKANPGMTPQQAQAKYWDENPAEYAAYRAAQRAA